MQSYEDVTRYTSRDGVLILTVFVAISPNISEPVRAFYAPLAESFKSVAQHRIYPLALEKYQACTDRRKRYRYTPLSANFSLVSLENDGVRLTVSSFSDIHIDEIHIWKDGVIAKKKQIKDNRIK